MRGSGGTRERDGPELGGCGFGPAAAACPWGCTLGPAGWSGAPFCPWHHMSSFADLPVPSQGPSQTVIQCKDGEVCLLWDDGPRVDYYGLGDDDDDEDSDYDEDKFDAGLQFLDVPVAEGTVPYSYCGFRKSFLCSEPPPQLPRTPPTTLDARLDRLPTPRRPWLTAEEAEKNAQELVAEEERAKRKAEKKKLKKKKQKDRKKREKLGQEQKNKENAEPSPPSSPAGTGPASDGAEDEGCCPEPSPCPGDSTVPSGEPGPEDTAVTEEELDLSCTFVCKAREKAGVKLPPPGSDRSPGPQNVEPSRKGPEKGSGDPVETPVSPQPLQPRPPSPSTVAQSLALAGHGIEAAQMGRHSEAVWAFTMALELNPREHRLLGNRSYCLEKLGRYEEALADAEAALALQPGWPKGSFRKGKALRGLQRYAEAALTFEELLLQDGAYAEAATQLEACQAQLQCSRPGGVPVSPFLLKAKEPLFLPAGWTATSCQETGDKSVMGGSARTPRKDPEQAPAVASGCPTLPPSHPARDCFPLWVGNITSHITEKVLRRAFGRFGEISSVRLLPGRHCAFINFRGKAEAEEAFRAMQGATMEGSKLLLQLKHPAHATPAPVPRAKGKATPGGLLS
ncbi:tetratricopeptide repeat protein 31 isoform X3 [Haemorhous mexicanus]|uniref:tetratricopeptide repeat protein 31 isoform X3 n=1 Tax=Haemorhous mexicanus TaxID=30427 RepID=UPI0028BD22E3|nr:tetratricopeptide repeat protein 31 isoform X3 [Haemorhous mexicanus]